MKKHILLTAALALTAAVPVLAADKASPMLPVLERYHVQKGGACGLTVEKTFQYGGTAYVLYSSAGYFASQSKPSHEHCDGGEATFTFRLAEIRNKRVVNDDLFSGTNINTRFLDVNSVRLNGAILTFKNNELGKDPETGEADDNRYAADIYLNQFDLKTRRVIKHEFIGRDKSNG